MNYTKEQKEIFREEQRFSGSPMMWIFPLVFVVSAGGLAYGMYRQLSLEKPGANHPTLDPVFILTVSFLLFSWVVVWFASAKSRLEVFIDGEGIHFRFPVFIRKWRTVKKETIARYEVQKYSPLAYAGWGYRRKNRSWDGRNEIVYTVRGKMGLRLYFSHKRLLLGTQRPEALDRAMKKLMGENEQNDG